MTKIDKNNTCESNDKLQSFIEKKKMQNKALQKIMDQLEDSIKEKKKKSKQ